MQPLYSSSPQRHKAYIDFLEQCHRDQATVQDIINLGSKLMSKEGLHHHFFADHSLLKTAEHLTRYALKESADLTQKITEPEALDVFSIFERRIADRIPVEYITNEASYAGQSFYVNQHVLVPRSIMSTRFHDFLNDTHWENNRVLDLCTGSGCIGITLALLNPNIQVDLADISSDALAVARINVEKHGLTDRIRCIQSDLFLNLQDKYDLIITNPPYVSTKEYQKSPDEFKNEPKIALEAGTEGLDLIHKILAEAKKYLNANGTLIAEVGFPAATLLKKHYPHTPFEWFKYRNSDGRESFFGMHGVFRVLGEYLL